MMSVVPASSACVNSQLEIAMGSVEAPPSVPQLAVAERVTSALPPPGRNMKEMFFVIETVVVPAPQVGALASTAPFVS